MGRALEAEEARAGWRGWDGCVAGLWSEASWKTAGGEGGSLVVMVSIHSRRALRLRDAETQGPESSTGGSASTCAAVCAFPGIPSP